MKKNVIEKTKDKIIWTLTCFAFLGIILVSLDLSDRSFDLSNNLEYEQYKNFVNFKRPILLNLGERITNMLPLTKQEEQDFNDKLREASSVEAIQPLSESIGISATAQVYVKREGSNELINYQVEPLKCANP